LSLLEVMLAIAILGLALATMGELVRIGTQAAAESRDLTKAQILSEGIMSELSAGIIPLESAEETPFELDPEWNYSVAVAPLDDGGLLEVTILVQKEIEDGEQPAYFTLTRWMIDPLLEQVEDPDTILGGDSETTSQTGATGQTGDQSGNQNAGGQNVGGQNAGGQNAAAQGGGFGGGPNQGGRGPGGDNQPGRGGPGGMNQGGRGGPPPGGQFGGNRQGGDQQGSGGRFQGNQLTPGRSGGTRGR
jgi:hypothetical protein